MTDHWVTLGETVKWISVVAAVVVIGIAIWAVYGDMFDTSPDKATMKVASRFVKHLGREDVEDAHALLHERVRSGMSVDALREATGDIEWPAKSYLRKRGFDLSDDTASRDVQIVRDQGDVNATFDYAKDADGDWKITRVVVAGRTVVGN